ncbi:hypothetical protein QTP70_006873 [Hemibagrus guttatus]|uniref:Reverse transcriptase domain-containing protein n=1 Tax=Hemibagrus guttatus TaxID=175788 RepID=A0AAE0RFX7_9TELE|nr:hypothetical protein QTP70_006873 [Hemibagrus guttatus]KAK3572581.1 hypothetical protein QTP86_000416 [Hemibagrus guttatus]
MAVVVNPSLDRSDTLNSFYAQFKAQSNVAARKTILTTSQEWTSAILPQSSRHSSHSTSLTQIHYHCSTGPTISQGKSSAIVPTCLKTTTIVPVPKKSMVSCFNDYRPITLTPIVMKCFERLIMRHNKTQLPPSLEPLQFAYHSNRFTDDAITTTLYLALTHLDNKNSYIQMLFIDFSSAFNTIILQHMIEKLSLLGLNTSLCNWILDFLTGKPQSVRIGNSISSTNTLSTGAPQGCVLSPLLFTLLTHDCAAMHSSNHIIKIFQ